MTTGKGYDFSWHDIICHKKYDEPQETYILGIPLTFIEEKTLLFNAREMSYEELKQKLMNMGLNCKYWKPRMGENNASIS